jgi:hypothetical protein
MLMSPCVMPPSERAGDLLATRLAPMIPGAANPARKNERREEDRPNCLIRMISASYFGRPDDHGIRATASLDAAACTAYR